MERDIVILSGERTGAVVQLAERTLVGRSEAADLRLADALVSMEHCQLLSTADGLSLEDLGSSNGVLVNGTARRKAALFHGDVVQVGGVSLLVRSPERRTDQELPSDADRRVTMVRVSDLPTAMAHRDVMTPPADEAFYVLHLINVLDVGRTMALTDPRELVSIVTTKVRYAVGAERCEALFVCEDDGALGLQGLDGKLLDGRGVPDDALSSVLDDTASPLAAYTSLDGERAGLLVPVLASEGVRRLTLFVDRPVAVGPYSAFERGLAIAVAVTLATPLSGGGIRTQTFQVLRGGELAPEE